MNTHPSHKNPPRRMAWMGHPALTRNKNSAVTLSEAFFSGAEGPAFFGRLPAVPNDYCFFKTAVPFSSVKIALSS